MTEKVRGNRSGVGAPGGRAARSGLTLVEVVTALVLVAVVSAVVVPTVFQRMRDARVDTIIGELKHLETGIMLFHRDVGRYPRRLDYLNALPSDALDSCGQTIPAPNRARYRGPYINRPIVWLGPTVPKYLLSTGDTVDVFLNRTTTTPPDGPGTIQVLQIRLTGPRLDMAQMIDERVDGVVDQTSGIIHWAGIPQPNYRVSWTMAIRFGTC